MKFYQSMFTACLTAIIFCVGLHAYDLMSTGAMVVLVTLCSVFGLSAVLKIYGKK